MGTRRWGTRAWAGFAAALLIGACDRKHEERSPAEDPLAAIANASPTLPAAASGAPLARDPATIYVVTTSAIWLGNTKVVDLPVDPKQENGMVIEPLLRAAEAAHKLETRVNGAYPTLLAADARTPYRVLQAVSYTLGQAECSPLRMIGKDASGALVVVPSSAPPEKR